MDNFDISMDNFDIFMDNFDIFMDNFVQSDERKKYVLW